MPYLIPVLYPKALRYGIGETLTLMILSSVITKYSNLSHHYRELRHLLSVRACNIVLSHPTGWGRDDKDDTL